MTANQRSLHDQDQTAMEEKIIISVSALPELFNCTLSAYKDLTVKARAWQKVSQEVGLTGKFFIFTLL
jgi:hypothetical protein